MRLRTPALAAFFAVSGLLLLLVVVALERPEGPAGKPFGITVAPVATQALAPEPEWMLKVQRALERMHIPIRGKNLEALLRTVDRSSTRFGIDPLAVLGIITIESEFDPLAVSPSGAMGLMQLRTDTARELAGELGIPWPSDDTLLDPDVNVLLGSFYLSRLIERFGDLDAALAAFHDGPGRVEVFGVQSGSVPLEYANRVWDAILRLDLRPIA